MRVRQRGMLQHSQEAELPECAALHAHAFQMFSNEFGARDGLPVSGCCCPALATLCSLPGWAWPGRDRWLVRPSSS
jgi:hypothetical protein